MLNMPNDKFDILLTHELPMNFKCDVTIKRGSLILIIVTKIRNIC